MCDSDSQPTARGPPASPVLGAFVGVGSHPPLPPQPCPQQVLAPGGTRCTVVGGVVLCPQCGCCWGPRRKPPGCVCALGNSWLGGQHRATGTCLDGCHTAVGGPSPGGRGTVSLGSGRTLSSLCTGSMGLPLLSSLGWRGPWRRTPPSSAGNGPRSWVGSDAEVSVRRGPGGAGWLPDRGPAVFLLSTP